HELRNTRLTNGVGVCSSEPEDWNYPPFRTHVSECADELLILVPLTMARRGFARSLAEGRSVMGGTANAAQPRSYVLTSLLHPWKLTKRTTLAIFLQGARESRIAPN